MIKDVVLDVFINNVDECVEVILTFGYADGSNKSWNFYNRLDDGDELSVFGDCDSIWELASEIAASAGIICHGYLSSEFDISVDDYNSVVDELDKFNEKYHTEIINDILEEQIYGDEVFDSQ